MTNPIRIFDAVDGGSINPLFRIKTTDFGVICDSLESLGVYWYDNMGSVAKFFNLYGYDNKDSKNKENALNVKLLNITSKNLDQIKSDLIDLLQLLPTGKYSCSFHQSTNEHLESGLNYYNIVFPLYDSAKTSEDELYKNFKLKFETVVHERGNYLPPRILDYSAIHFYDGYERHILATKHDKELDSSRINFYKEAIAKGNRPAIVVNSCMDENGISNPFILDGHHKAKAYLDLQINPAIIEIIGDTYEQNNEISDLRQIEKALFIDQMIFLIKQNYEFEKIISEISNDTVLSKYCLNGEVIDFYPNGRIRQKGNYFESKRNGIFYWYYPDGSLEKKEKYEMGHIKCTYEKYFHNGSLLIKGDENGLLEQYDIYGNRIK